MSAFNEVIDKARLQLPTAFSVGGTLPFSTRRERILPLTGELSLFAKGGDAKDINENFLPSGEENIEDFDEANNELGFDCTAFYVSFHRPTLGEQLWGIFYWDHRIRQLAEKIRRAPNLSVRDRGQAATLALEIVRRHELFHFRFDVWALYQELVLGKPLYNNYHDSVYRKVLFTEECYEEALANRACAYSRNWPDRVPLGNFVENLCRDAPPGYRDFGKHLNLQRNSLGGQLIHTTAQGRFPLPQSRWVGDTGPITGRSHCPEYILINGKADSRVVLHLVCKAGGLVIDFHKYDLDPWPSKFHGHVCEDGYKLDISNGDLYDERTRNIVGKLKPKDFSAVRQRLEEKWPDVELPQTL